MDVTAVIGGTCLAAGYAIGALAGWSARSVSKRRRVLPIDSMRRYGGLLLGASWPAGVLLGSAR